MEISSEDLKELEKQEMCEEDEISVSKDKEKMKT